MTNDQPSLRLHGNPTHSLEQQSESLGRPTKLAKIENQVSVQKTEVKQGNEVTVEEEEEDRETIIGEETMNRNPGAQRYLVAIEYIGTRFAGAQKQPRDRTVVGVLEEAFGKFVGKPVSIYCSSRTDAGVHALSNVCHIDVERVSKRRPGEVLPPHEPDVVKRAVNHFLQKKEGDISVIDVRCVPPDFHARYKAQERTYFYRLLSGPEPLSVLERNQAWHVSEELDIMAMQRACKILAGCHDFSSFRAAACQAKSPIRSLDELSVTEVFSTPYFPSSMERDAGWLKDDSGGAVSTNKSNSDIIIAHNTNVESNPVFGIRKRHRCYVVTARARSFLYHQVRLLVGVLKCAGTGEVTNSDVERILEAKTVTAARPMAPSCGLYLGHVKYDLPALD
ncbi:tRNA pseudouridine synthase A [Impatiens glandulifera]|uniref:tRNA pseudouridine synthase A n=1 Tax=Impatiens glandulifera TaxID=253017 RepID=UPI001FB0A64A|nr:tRNA pseudouridine synthase A [Impatiens glandulifera]